MLVRPLGALCGCAISAAAAVTAASVARRSRAVRWPLGALPCGAAEVGGRGEPKAAAEADSAGEGGEGGDPPSPTRTPPPLTPTPLPASPPPPTPLPASPPPTPQAADGALLLSHGGSSGDWPSRQLPSRQLPGTAATFSPLRSAVLSLLSPSPKCSGKCGTCSASGREGELCRPLEGRHLPAAEERAAVSLPPGARGPSARDPLPRDRRPLAVHAPAFGT